MSTKSIKETGADASVDLFISTDPQVQEASANKLLECLTQEKNDSVRDKIGDAVAEVARQYSDKGRTRAKQLQSLRADHFRKGHNWVDLLNALSQLSQSGEAGQRVTAYRVFATTPDIIEKEHEQAVIGAFTKGFEDPDTHVYLSPVSVRQSANRYCIGPSGRSRRIRLLFPASCKEQPEEVLPPYRQDSGHSSARQGEQG